MEFPNSKIAYVHDYTKFAGNNYPTCSDVEFANKIKKNEQLYEVIKDDCLVKCYFDVDEGYIVDADDGPDYKMLDNVETGLKTFLSKMLQPYSKNPLQIAVANNHRFKKVLDEKEHEYKASWRFYIHNLVANKKMIEVIVHDLNYMLKERKPEANCFFETDERLKNYGIQFDSSVYSKERKMRCINTIKPDDFTKTPLKLASGTVEQTIITGCFDDNSTILDYKYKYSNGRKKEITKKQQKPEEEESTDAETETDNEDQDKENKTEKYKNLLNIIKIDSKDRNTWLGVCACIKGIGLPEHIWSDFCKKNNLNFDKEKQDLFKNIKTDEGSTEDFLIFLAKKTNKKLYNEWCETYTHYDFDVNDIDDPFKTAKSIHEHLKKRLILCEEEWYVLNESNNLWSVVKEPSFYVAEELHKYLENENVYVAKKIQNETDKDRKDKLMEHQKFILKHIKDVSKPAYLNQVIKYLKKLLCDNSFAEKLDNNGGKIAFKNGIFDIKNNYFRPYISYNDYITKTIPHNYKECDVADDEDCEFILQKLKEIMNNNEQHLIYYLSVIAYSLLGLANLEKQGWFLLDKTENSKGDNGKTFFFSVLNELMPCYVYKSKPSFFENGNTKFHKQIAVMKGHRIVWFDEAPQNKLLNAELYKTICDGGKIENEVMFGTSEKINVTFKTFILSNHILSIPEKEDAVYNRLRQISHNSHFDRTGERKVANPEKLEFIADKHLYDIFLQKKDAIFNILIHTAKKYFENNGLPKVPIEFERDVKITKDKNNKFACWFNENCEIDDVCNISLKLIAKKSGMKEDYIKTSLKDMGYLYNKELKGVGSYKVGMVTKYHKGGFTGFKIIEDNDDDNDVNQVEEE